jgi:hypothetical protein
MGRSKIILGKVLRNLKRSGVSVSTVEDKEIYSEMSQSLWKILSDTNTDRMLSLELKEGVNSYPLTTDTISTEESAVHRQNISSIKSVIVPEQWRYIFVILSHQEFASIINGSIPHSINWNELILNWGLDEFNFDISSLRTKQPVMGAIIDQRLEVYPTPDEDYDGDILKFIVNVRGPEEALSETVDPSLPENFDKAIEFFATAQFLSGRERGEFEALFAKELLEQRPSLHKKHHQTNRPRVW